MRTKSSNEGVDNRTEGACFSLPLPVTDSDLFKHSASAPVLNFLADNPEFDLSVRQLSRVTSVSDRATGDAVDSLAANGLVETFHEGNARRVRLNRTRFKCEDDPIARIPQVTYRIPVRIAKQYIGDELSDVIGIILFGSVARGEADRQSDIDIWILVDGTSADVLEQRNAANTLARHLETLQIPESIDLATVAEGDITENWSIIRDRLEADENPRQTAQRYSFEFVVESPETIRAQSNRVEAPQLFGDGITLLSTPTLDAVKQDILVDE